MIHHTFLRVIECAIGPFTRFESPAPHPLILEESGVNIKHPILADKLSEIVPLDCLEEQREATRLPHDVLWLQVV